MPRLGCAVDFGADVCHLNLHKPYPHHGGGPGMGPIVMPHLVRSCLGILSSRRGEQGIGAAVRSTPGASILTISLMYIAMMGAAGLTEATKVAILNANYIARRLEPYYPVVYKGNRL